MADKPCKKLTVAINPPVREALRQRAAKSDITPAAVARHILSSWARDEADRVAA